MPQTTIVYSPHPDDETLRLSSYISFAEQRGDNLILVSVSGGGSSSIRDTFCWTSGMLIDHRVIEQKHAWSALTKGRGQIIHLNIPDGEVLASVKTITSLANDLEMKYSAAGPVEHYVAAKDDDVHSDHRAVVQGVRSSSAKIVRVSFEPGKVGGSVYKNTYNPSGTLAAYNAYRSIGHLSVPTLFQHLKNSGFSSYITR